MSTSRAASPIRASVIPELHGEPRSNGANGSGRVASRLTGYGADVFSDAVMRQMLPKAVYRSLRETVRKGQRLDPAIADTVAASMKGWAIEGGATHYCHCFSR